MAKLLESAKFPDAACAVLKIWDLKFLASVQFSDLTGKRTRKSVESPSSFRTRKWYGLIYKTVPSEPKRQIVPKHIDQLIEMFEVSMQGKESSREEGRMELPDGFVPGPKDIICGRGELYPRNEI